MPRPYCSLLGPFPASASPTPAPRRLLPLPLSSSSCPLSVARSLPSHARATVTFVPLLSHTILGDFMWLAAPLDDVLLFLSVPPTFYYSFLLVVASEGLLLPPSSPCILWLLRLLTRAVISSRSTHSSHFQARTWVTNIIDVHCNFSLRLRVPVIFFLFAVLDG
ncbi:hypothetical protein H4582DRAFT_1031980 [Lactarius indigo]|nr:hypothetical protein H4582DRAFT_1031980 [Lactarius indigo]